MQTIQKSTSDNLEASMQKEEASIQKGVSYDFKSKIVSLLEEKYSFQSLTHQSLCSDLNTSRSTLHRLIKMHFDLTTAEFINDFRLKKSLHLIRQNKWPISEIAHKVGYKDAKYFSRLFSKKFNMSPMKYKIININKPNF